jgi:D-3-phosphoglycerate dehydrogenase
MAQAARLRAALLRSGGVPQMSETLRPLILDLVAFVAEGPRPYAEVLDVWRTSCPRLTVWEDAVEAGLVMVRDGTVHATEAGRQALRHR